MEKNISSFSLHQGTIAMIVDAAERIGVSRSHLIDAVMSYVLPRLDRNLIHHIQYTYPG